MKQYDIKVNARIGDHVQNINVSDNELTHVPHEYLIDLEQEDETFYNEFTKAIKNPSIREDDNEYNMEYGENNPYLGVKLGLPSGPDDDIQHARVKKR